MEPEGRDRQVARRRAGRREAKRPDGNPPSLLARLWLFGIANYVLLVVLSGRLVEPGAFSRLSTGLYVLAVHLTYPAFYLLLGLGPVVLLALAGERRARISVRWPSPGGAIVGTLAVMLTTLIAIALYADVRTHEIFGFHLNGFVLNLILTPGGIASMGATTETYLTAGLLCASTFAVEAFVYLALGRSAGVARIASRLVSRRAVLVSALAFLGCSSYERIAFGWSDLIGYRPLLRYADSVPLYMHLRFKGLAKSLGYRPARRDRVELDLADSALDYPLAPIGRLPPEPGYNVVWLCAESLRSDALDQEIMPATWALARHSIRFDQHMSGGNGTRMGVFSMFYGLPSYDWFSFLREQRGPVLIDALLERGYQIEAFTSDDFSYPEFAKTVFARIPAEHLHEYGGQGRSFERDQRNIGDLLAAIDRFEPERPFFVFSFLESPHAPYDFPARSVIRRPYLEKFNYLTADLSRDIEQIRNRYLNSVHHLDSQIARVISFLQERRLMNSTLLIVTGDHGEEFMEKGRWGHNSAFVEEQIRVPLVLWAPGQAPRAVHRLTSHVDLPVTVLRLLGLRSDPARYTTGLDLLGRQEHDYVVLGDWGSVVYLDDEVKIRFPTRSLGGVGIEVWSRDDEPVEDEDAVLEARAGRLASMLRSLTRFRSTRHGRSGVHNQHAIGPHPPSPS